MLCLRPAICKTTSALLNSLSAALTAGTAFMAIQECAVAPHEGTMLISEQPPHEQHIWIYAFCGTFSMHQYDLCIRGKATHCWDSFGPCVKDCAEYDDILKKEVRQSRYLSNTVANWDSITMLCILYI
ncbi:hypothetical protein DENSPDRAFT_359713 [Dentipellis sp. KUC8613]|nr:hypothetical protein DENSPDRAFT_359713 [Dentipellis sp. KUC8613]